MGKVRSGAARSRLAHDRVDLTRRTTVGESPDIIIRAARTAADAGAERPDMHPTQAAAAEPATRPKSEWIAAPDTAA